MQLPWMFWQTDVCKSWLPTVVVLHHIVKVRSVFSCHNTKQPASIAQVGTLEDVGSKWYKQSTFRVIACLRQKRFSKFSFPTTILLVLIGKTVNPFASDVGAIS